MSTLAVLPVKSFSLAKQRLAEELQPGPRKALAEAMFADVLTALRRSASVDQILVVTGDISAQRLAGSHGVDVLDDDEERGQSAAAEVGIRRAVELGHDRVLLVPGDTPALVPADLDRLVGRARGATPDAVIVPDRHGSGTNALLLTPPRAIAPAFGPESLERHVAAARDGNVAHDVIEVESLGLDVDTPADLVALRERLTAVRGGAAHTRGLLTRLDRVAAAAA